MVLKICGASGVVHLLKGAGSTLLESEDTQHKQMASEIFSELHKLDDSDRYAAAGLLAPPGVVFSAAR